MTDISQKYLSLGLSWGFMHKEMLCFHLNKACSITRCSYVCSSQVRGHSGSKDVRQSLQDIQRQNQLRSAPPSPRRHKRRWSQIRSEGVLPKPAPQEEDEPFILDLKNFPDLANADLGSQNPNIQVRTGPISPYCHFDCLRVKFLPVYTCF